jgi:hypothetical protein
MSDFATEAQATLRLLGTAIEEGRISLELGALQLSALHQRHGVFLSEVGAGIVLACWCGARPATPPGHPLHVPPPQPSQETLQLAMLQATIGLLGDLTDRSMRGDLGTEDLCQVREAHIEALRGLGYVLSGNGEVVPA